MLDRWCNRELNMFGDFDMLFNQISRDFFNNRSRFKGIVSKASYPKVDIKDTPSAVIIEATVPGLTKDDISVEHKNDILTISSEAQSNGDDFLFKEIHKSSFKRGFTLPEDEFDVENIDGKCENGILILTIPKKNAQNEQAKKIEIN